MNRSDQKKQAALAALMESNSLTEAASKAGVDRRTLYNYLHNDQDFAQAYREVREQQAIALMEDLNERRQQAQDVIMHIMEKNIDSAVRLKAAQIILTAAQKQCEIVTEITERNVRRNTSPFDIFAKE